MESLKVIVRFIRKAYYKAYNGLSEANRAHWATILAN